MWWVINLAVECKWINRYNCRKLAIKWKKSTVITLNLKWWTINHGYWN